MLFLRNIPSLYVFRFGSVKNSMYKWESNKADISEMHVQKWRFGNLSLGLIKSRDDLWKFGFEVLVHLDTAK